MDHDQDSMSGAPIRDSEQLKLVKKKIFNQQLVDPWRITYPSKKDYTFHSSVHDTYLRLDYILVDHGVLEYVVETAIGIISISDHTPVIVNIRFNDRGKRKGIWRLSEDLVDDVKVGQIITEIEHYFYTNDTPDVTKATIWEAHKTYIRSKLISIGAGKKKVKEKTYEKGNKRTI